MKAAQVYKPHWGSSKKKVAACSPEFMINVVGEKLSDRRFADDVALTTEDVKDMAHQLNTVNEES